MVLARRMFESWNLAFPPLCFQILPIWLQKDFPCQDRNSPIYPRTFISNSIKKIHNLQFFFVKSSCSAKLQLTVENVANYHTKLWLCGLPLRISWNRLTSSSIRLAKYIGFISYVFTVLADLVTLPIYPCLDVFVAFSAISRNFCHSTSQKIVTLDCQTAISRKICHSTSVQNCNPRLLWRQCHGLISQKISLFECLKVFCLQSYCLELF